MPTSYIAAVGDSRRVNAIPDQRNDATISMYAQILDAAFRERPSPLAGTNVSEALSVFLYWRDRLSPFEMQADSTIALARQVAYDIALIELARSIGLDVDPNTFDQPERRRTELRREFDRTRYPSRQTRSIGSIHFGARLTFYSGHRAVKSGLLEPNARRYAAKVAACVRRSTPSLAKRFEMQFFMVFSARIMRSAIWRFV